MGDVACRSSSSASSGQWTLWDCARFGDVKRLQSAFFPESARYDGSWNDVDERNDLGETALHLAASCGQDRVVWFLLRHQADVFAKDQESGWTPLHRSVYHQHFSTCLLLLRFVRARDGPKVMLRLLHQTLDYANQSPIDLLSSRLSDELHNNKISRTGHVYTFGKADFQLGYHLPHADVQYTPRRVELPLDSPIINISAGKYHTVAVNAAGKCFAWGFGKGGRLGMGTEYDHIEPSQVTSLSAYKVIKVSAGENHSLALTETGQVFSWGANGFGQLGHSAKTCSAQSRLSPKRIEALRSFFVVDIAAGSAHSACVSSDGIVFTWGSNKKGQLGHHYSTSRIGTDQCFEAPKVVDALTIDSPYSAFYGHYDWVAAKRVAVSDAYTCVIIKCMASKKSSRIQSQLWQFGYGSNFPARVHLGDKESSYGSGMGRSLRSGSLKAVHSDVWVPGWRLAQQNGEEDILQVACAPNHAIALTSSGLVYTWGYQHDALSHPKNTNVPVKVGRALQVSGLAKYGKAISVCASHDHCAVATEHGDLVTWGCGHEGILGHGLGNWQPDPKRVARLKKVVAVEAGNSHTCVLVAPYQPVYATPLSRLNSEGVDANGGKWRASLSDDSNADLLIRDVSESDADDSDEEEDVVGSDGKWGFPRHHASGGSAVSSLFDLCQQRLSEYLDPSNVLMVSKYAELYNAQALEMYCGEFMRLNMDTLLEMTRDRMELFWELVFGEGKEEEMSLLRDMEEVLRTPTSSKKAPQSVKRPELSMKTTVNKRRESFAQSADQPEEDSKPLIQLVEVSASPASSETASMAIDARTAPKVSKRKKFVPLSEFLNRVAREEWMPSKAFAAAPRNAVESSAWQDMSSGKTVSAPQQLNLREQEFTQVARRRESSADESQAPKGSASAASSRSFFPEPVNESSASPTSSTFSLEQLLRASSEKRRQGRRRRPSHGDDNVPVVAWANKETASVESQALKTKSLLEIQQEQEEIEQRNNPSGQQHGRRHRSGSISMKENQYWTMNSWGLCEDKRTISLLEVQQLQANQGPLDLHIETDQKEPKELAKTSNVGKLKDNSIKNIAEDPKKNAKTRKKHKKANIPRESSGKEHSAESQKRQSRQKMPKAPAEGTSTKKPIKSPKRRQHHPNCENDGINVSNAGVASKDSVKRTAKARTKKPPKNPTAESSTGVQKAVAPRASKKPMASQI